MSDAPQSIEQMVQAYKCTKCGSTNGWRHEVDIGVGTQLGPWHCDDCGWSEAEPCPICGGLLECKPGCMDGTEGLL